MFLHFTEQKHPPFIGKALRGTASVGKRQSNISPSVSVFNGYDCIFKKMLRPSHTALFEESHVYCISSGGVGLEGDFLHLFFNFILIFILNSYFSHLDNYSFIKHFAIQ